MGEDISDMNDKGKDRKRPMSRIDRIQGLGRIENQNTHSLSLYA